MWLLMASCYVAAIATACGVLLQLHAQWSGLADGPLWAALAADTAATLVTFAFSVATDNSSCVDAYWSVSPPLLAAYWAAVGLRAGAPVARAALVVAGTLFWGVRLTHNWARQWTGWAHEDWRYVDFRRKTGRAYWLVSLLGIHLFPTKIVFLGCVPLYGALARGTAAVGPSDAAASALLVAAVSLQIYADNELRRFMLGRQASRTRARQGALLTAGAWGWCRNPNYLGEICFWWSLYLFSLGSGARWAAPAASGWAGAASITLMFLGVSIPMKETRMAQRRESGAWAEYTRRVPMLLPLGRLRNA